MADTEEKTMLPEVAAYFATMDAATAARDSALGITAPYGCCPSCDSEDTGKPYTERAAAWNVWRTAEDKANTALRGAEDPLVRWIAENVKDYTSQRDQVLRALPATLAELDALAEEQGWCSIWRNLRDRAVDASVVPGVAAASARVQLDRQLARMLSPYDREKVRKLVDALLKEQQEAQVSA